MPRGYMWTWCWFSRSWIPCLNRDLSTGPEPTTGAGCGGMRYAGAKRRAGITCNHDLSIGSAYMREQVVEPNRGDCYTLLPTVVVHCLSCLHLKNQVILAPHRKTSGPKTISRSEELGAPCQTCALLVLGPVNLLHTVILSSVADYCWYARLSRRHGSSTHVKSCDGDPGSTSAAP
ncbi:hypothetical protein HBI71_105030 [Parastagonospora nodorum]|nr:hypothetical protein HBI71_105030 [Parastagonospora nodorum]